ncbi:SusD/RagB family nutrient-binding outer membrane lipoprotein [Fulvivirgaceae bacterium PWU5]|uniref:SusD/RagB family nutrient-binding outer membrane lipoprotein n=1 Tax=Dawidia cretensis TaxID=2782350 RepID=A0AAP2GPG4_9BACT|nr:SusD/RagB family nutrient-binding outer membrane lipoprotein [Dawidia cretensis]MBT1708611.1 SusD/RagB family nutrient-binding outer membrane lipoprotein [Dawidia cretensis]
MKLKYFAIGILMVCLSCDDLTELNENPNGVEPGVINPNLVLPTVVTEASKLYLNLGFGNIAGVMQHTQLDAWFDEHNDYAWTNQSWTPYYGVLRDNKVLYERSAELHMEFHQGVSLIMKSMMFGLITDLWGDAPYTNALNGDLSGLENKLPVFDDQETIYRGIIADLETANTLLSKDKQEYIGLYEDDEVPYASMHMDPALWRKMANSLLLRYYMRISSRLPDVSRQGIEKIYAHPDEYPLITSSDEDATMSYAGNSEGDSWPSNAVFDASGSNYRRNRMCATLVEVLQASNDARLGVWASKVEIPLVVDAGLPEGTDKIEDGMRYLSPDVVGAKLIDTDPEYVGIPPSISNLPSGYNLNPTPGQTSNNPHVSYLSPIYADAAGPLLKARLISAAEVHFILAEAALKGWATGAASEHYLAGIQASFETWGVADTYDDYVTQPGVMLSGDTDERLEKVMMQKWIASWSATTESWFDYRRTGLPVLSAGPAAARDKLPVRFYYMQDEIEMNAANTAKALERLEKTQYTQADGANSAWSKPWLLQGTSKPW